MLFTACLHTTLSVRARLVAVDSGVNGGCARALLSALDYFQERGFTVHAILPRWALDGGRECRASSKLREAHVLDSHSSRIHLAPAGIDDDDFILSLAVRMKACILSNDLFRDHVKMGRIEQGWLEAHLLPFMFVEGQLLVPSSTLGLLMASDASAPLKLKPHAPCLSPPPTTSSKLVMGASSLVTSSSQSRVVRRLALVHSSSASSSASTLARPRPRQGMFKAKAPGARGTSSRHSGRQGSGPSMRELLSRPRQPALRF